MTSLDIRALQKALDKLDAYRAELCEAVLASQAPDFAGYARKVGEYQGIKRSIEILKEVEKELGQ